MAPNRPPASARRHRSWALTGLMLLVAGCHTESPTSAGPVPAPVDVHTATVAAIPRPAVLPEPAARDCPHLQRGLTDWDPAWISPGGVAEVPPGIRAVVRGNASIPADLLLAELRVPATSELVFDDRPATYRVGDVRISGAVLLGSERCRLESDIEFVFDTAEPVGDAIVRNAIAERSGLGIVVEPGGSLDVFGRLFQPTWTRLSSTASAGEHRLVLAEPVDWEPGHQVVVVTSTRRDYPYEDGNEVRSIAAVDGASLTLDRPLAHRHYGGPEYQVEVGLLSRSIVFRTAERVREAAPGFGGHIMAAGSTRISGAGLVGLGQQNHTGRYPFHLHEAGDVAGGSSFTDNAVWDSNWRCAVIHRTDGAVISRNVGFDVFGHCFYLEDGIERDNEISFNLAARIKIMGPTDAASLSDLAGAQQAGFVLDSSPGLVDPTDRAAAGFYLPNGDNRVFGNAASGGFAGFTFPGLPDAIGGAGSGARPIDVPIAGFDGNTAHTSGYLWWNGGCVYVGGVLSTVEGPDGPVLRYQSGRPADEALLRSGDDVISNLKTFLCRNGVVHWGSGVRVVNVESADNGLLAQVFGASSIESAVVLGSTKNTPRLEPDPVRAHTWGFRFYDTDAQTILSDIVFRGFHGAGSPGIARSRDDCALLTMAHSDRFTPQRNNATARIHFDSVDDRLRFCHDDTGTLASRNFTLDDTDGSLTSRPGDGITGPRLIGSGHTDAWAIDERCVHDEAWGLWVCPAPAAGAASIATYPNRAVEVAIRDLSGAEIGRTGYSGDADFAEAQITAPSGTWWDHRFPGRPPAEIAVSVLQVPDDGFVLYSVALAPGTSCSIAGWVRVEDLAALLEAAAAGYTTDGGTCFVWIPPADGGLFEAAGLRLPRQTVRASSPLVDFTIVVG